MSHEDVPENRVLRKQAVSIEKQLVNKVKKFFKSRCMFTSSLYENTQAGKKANAEFIKKHKLKETTEDELDSLVNAKQETETTKKQHEIFWDFNGGNHPDDIHSHAVAVVNKQVVLIKKPQLVNLLESLKASHLWNGKLIHLFKLITTEGWTERSDVESLITMALLGDFCSFVASSSPPDFEFEQFLYTALNERTGKDVFTENDKMVVRIFSKSYQSVVAI